MNEMRYCDIYKLPQSGSFVSAIYHLIKSANQQRFSKEEIYTALHKMVDIQIYEFEVTEIL